MGIKIIRSFYTISATLISSVNILSVAVAMEPNNIIPYEISTTSHYSVFTRPPSDFVAKLEAVGCFLEHEDRILLLKRNVDKPEGNTWGIPGGKVDKGETLLEAVKRETLEETGLDIGHSAFKVIGTNYLILPTKNVTFHMYRVHFSEQPIVHLAVDESQKYKWFTVEEALEKSLMPGEIESFIRYKHWSNSVYSQGFQYDSII